MTNEERIQKFKSGEIAVNCSTEEESRQFIEWCYRNDIRWTSNDNDNDTIRTYFYVNKENTCYKFSIASGGLLYSSKKFYVNEGIDVITYKEFMKGYKKRMTNLEKYYDELINGCYSPNCYWLEVIKKGNCHEMSCKKCGMDFVHWLNEEYKENKEPIKLTKVQYEILKCLPQCSSMQMLNNEMIIHKDNLEFFLSKLGVKIIDSDNHEEKSIKIKDILENCEVITFKEFMDKPITNLEYILNNFDRETILNTDSICMNLRACLGMQNCVDDNIKRIKIHCCECKFDDQYEVLKCLNEIYKEPITKLTKVQHEILKCLPTCSKISLKNNKINIHKDNLEYLLSKIGVQVIESDCDDKQIKIKDILEKCEVVE